MATCKYGIHSLSIVALFGLFTPLEGLAATSTATNLVVTPATIVVGDTVTFTATVSAASGTPTGLVTFFDGVIPLGSGTLNGAPGNDQATFSTSLLAAFVTHSITAVYNGDANFTASPASPSASVVVQLRKTTTTVAMNPATVIVGQPTTATVTVNDAGTSSPLGTPDVFSATGTPLTGRTGFTLTAFSDTQVLLAGGMDNNGNVLNSAEIYTVSAGSFAATNGHLNTARTGAVAVLLPNGKVLIAGGSSTGDSSGALASAELFDPAAGTFTPTSQNMTVARFATMATLLNNGRVLLSGGENSGGVLSTAELYDPATDSFTATGNLNTARSGATSILVGPQSVAQVLIAGGSSDGTPKGALNTAELFDPSGNGGAGAFTLLTSTLSAARWQPQAGLIFGTDVIVAGGQDSSGALTSADEFSFNFSNFRPFLSFMAVPRANGAAIGLPNGMVLLAGGAGASQVSELLDPRSGFHPTGNLLQVDTGLAAALLNDGRVLAVGLTSGSADAELYSPSFNPSGPLQIEASDRTQPTLTGSFVHLIPSSNSPTAATATVTFSPIDAANNPLVITAGRGFGTIDGVHSPAIGMGNLSMTAAATTTGITSSANPSVFGGSVTFTATVTDSSPGSAVPPAGTVQFVVDGVNLGSPATLFSISGNSSSANVATTLAVPGSPHNVSANFVNTDGSFVASTGSLSGGQTVMAASTTTTVVSSVASPAYGQGLTFNATIVNTGSGSTGAPTGSVQFVVDGQNIGSPIPLSAASSNSSTATSGSISTLNVSGGSPHTVAAKYLNADSNFANSSGLLSGGLQVSPAHLTLIANSQSKIYDGATFTGFSATLAGFVNGETDAGLRSSGALLGSAGFTGPAVSAINAGQYTITPTPGSLAASNYDFPAANPVNGILFIVKANTTSLTTEAATPLNDPVNGGSLSFMAVVASSSGGPPTGSVQFTDDKNGNLSFIVSLSITGCPSGTPPNAACAKFSPAATQLAMGSQTITASYQGDNNFNGSSAGVEVTILPAIITSPGQTIPPQVITFENTAVLTNQDVTLSCLVQAATIPVSPRFPTCSLSSTSFPASGAVTVTLSTFASTAAALDPTRTVVASRRTGGAVSHPMLAVLNLEGFGLLGLVLLARNRGRKKSARIQVQLGLTLSILLFVLGCGGGGGATVAPPVAGTPSGTYLVSVVGTDTNHNPVLVATIALNVQ